jgi:hypothetical protein
LACIWSRHWICSAEGQTTKHRADTVAEHELVDDEAGLDGLAEAHIIGEEDVCARHAQAANQRVELIILEFDPAPKWRLKGSAIGRGDRAPTNGIQEGVKDNGIVKACWLRQRAPFERSCGRLDLPDNLQGLAGALVIDRRKGDQMLRLSRPMIG